MTEISREILDKYQIRKTGPQKTAFIEFLKGKFPHLRVEAGGFPKSRNLVVGDPDRAKVIFCAHYDTCAVLPFPNLITPKKVQYSTMADSVKNDTSTAATTPNSRKGMHTKMLYTR